MNSNIFRSLGTIVLPCKQIESLLSSHEDKFKFTTLEVSCFSGVL